MYRKILPIVASVAVIGTTSLTTHAKTPDTDYIVSEIWSDWWHGKNDDGLVYPEASYKHHILTEWAEENCQHTDDSIGQLKYQFRDYYDDFIEGWDLNDDHSGNWTIDTPETTYHFNLQDGKWLMSNDNGDVIDSFMPFSTLKKEVTNPDNSASYEIEGNDSNGHRVGEGLMIESSASAEIAKTESSEQTERSSSNGLIYGISVIIIAGIAVLAGIFIKKKRS